MNDSKLYCCSKKEFEKLITEWGGKLPIGLVAISILGTPECQKRYLEEDGEHMLPSSPRVLNLNFDDIAAPVMQWKTYTFTGITPEQADEAVEFIENNIGLDFIIHCRAGISRSQAFVRYILDTHPEVYKLPWAVREDNPPISPNYYVLSELKKAYNRYETRNNSQA